MEKIEFKQHPSLKSCYVPWYRPKAFEEGHDFSGDYYRASDVDAYRQAVKGLVGATKNLAIKSAENKGDITAEDFGKLWKAIAAVERLGG